MTTTPSAPLGQDASIRHCTAQCVASSFEFEGLKAALETRYRLVAYLDALHIAQANWEALVFPYGTFVGWGMNYDAERFLLEELRPYCNDRHATPFVDRFTYVEEAGNTRLHNDHIELSSNATLDKVAVAHGLAQSVKLMEFENRAQRTIEETSYIPENIARHGRVNLSRKAIAKLRGTLYLVRSDIHLHYDLLDTPEFFWEFPELQETYHSISNYLEIEPRVRLLSDKLDLIHELLDMLADEQNHKHSSTLEWIIIWLIAVEIVIFIFFDILKLF